MQFDQGRAVNVAQNGLERAKTRRSLYSEDNDGGGVEVPFDEDRSTKKLKAWMKSLKESDEDERSRVKQAIKEESKEVEVEGGKEEASSSPPLTFDDIDQIPLRLRLYHDLHLSQWKNKWDRKMDLFMKFLRYGTYCLFFAYVTIAALNQIGIGYKSVEWLVFCLWVILIGIYSISFLVLGGWQRLAWHGWPVLCQHGCEIGIILILLFSAAARDESTANYQAFEYLALVIMGVYMFIREMMVFPVTTELRLFYCGASSAERFVEIIKEWEEAAKTGKMLWNGPTSDEQLIEILELSRKVLGISPSVPIRQALVGQNLRDEPIGRGYDWALVVQKLTKLVSLAPGFCRSDTKMTSLQCRNLIRQVLVFDEMYRKTGKIKSDAFEHRTLPYSTTETFMAMLSLSCKIPCSFVNAIIPGVLQGFVMVFVGANIFGQFAAGLELQPLCSLCLGTDPPSPYCTEDAMARTSIYDTVDECVAESKAKATFNFWFLVLATSVGLPLIFLWISVTWSAFVAKLGDYCRRQMLTVLVRGGTEYSEIHVEGKLTDAFSNQLAKLEIFAFGAFLAAIPATTALIMAIFSAIPVYPFASAVFVALIPTVLSLSFVDDAQGTASAHQGIADAEFSSRIGSIVECRAAVRTCNAGNWVETGTQDLLKRLKITHQGNYFMAALVMNLFTASTSIFGLFILIPLGLLVLEGALPFSQFLPVYSILMTLQGTVQFVGLLKGQLGIYSATLQIVTELIDNSLDEERSLPPINKNKKKKDEIDIESTSKSSSSTCISPLSQEMKINDVVFRYENMETNVLENLNMHFGKGMYTVLTGGSGSGKSTILSLLMRFRKPNDGSIEWDGTNIFTVPLESFREQVAVMFQKTMIYQASVRDNILFGLPERPGGVEEAAEMAEIAEAIRALPNGYDTIIGGDSAGGLSGGQMQRICLARALYRQPSVLLLDEATSALDAVTEDAIIETLVELRDKKGITLVSVSHHPMTAVKADQIVVLDKGTVAEEGTFDALMARENGIFRELVEITEKEKAE